MNESLEGKRPYFWLSENPKKDKASVKVVGDSLKARVYDTKRDALVLFYHPISHKNRGLKEKFESYAKQADQSKLLVARCNGINESSVFKTPAKLPAIVHFSSLQIDEEPKSDSDPSDAPFGKATSRVKEAVEFQFTRNYMLRNSSEDDFKQAMDQFMKENASTF